MNKKISIWLGVGILAIIALIAFSYPNSQKEKTSDKAAALSMMANIAAPETNYDFGAISMAAGKVTHNFEVQNTSSSTISLGKLYTSCMCTIAYFVNSDGEMGPFGMPGMGFIPPLNKELKPVEKATIRVVFDPAAHGPAGVGIIDRVVYLGSDGDMKMFGIKALVTP
jgi:hypothetical protein